MSPQWLPQNIQKRLLLYVLQQLSLFSEIDLPNLEEVSLNNIHLKDVSIDPEKVGRLPGCNLRYGQVGSLELNGGVMGGVNVEANNVEIVIAPNLDINEDLTKSVQNQLFQSTADLANTIMIDDDFRDSNDTIDEVEQKSDSPTKTSALGGVMQRAVELALLRLQVKVTNLNIKLVSELTDLMIVVDEVLFNTVNGTRSVKIKGINLICLKPDVNGGDEEGDEQTEDEEEEEEEKDDTETSDDDYDDGIDQSLMDSMVFTHEEASSIYMSATSQSFNNNIKPESESKEKVIMHVDELELEFEGLSDLSELAIDINEIVISCHPLVPSVLSIMNGISRGLKLRMYQKRKQGDVPKPSDFPQYETDDVIDEDTPQIFNKLHIANIIVSLTSAVRANGKFASPKNNLYLNLGNLNVKQKNDNLIFGGIETFRIVQTIKGVVEEIFKFDKDEENETKADLRFEKCMKNGPGFKGNEFTMLLSKKCEINLNSTAIADFIQMGEYFSMISNHLTGLMNTFDSYKLLTATVKPKKLDNQVVIQTSNIIINFNVNNDSLSVKLLPISFNLLNNGLKCQKVLIDLNTEESVNIGKIENISLLIKAKDFVGYLNSTNSPKKVNLKSGTNFRIAKIDFDLTFDSFNLIIGHFNRMNKEITKSLKSQTKKEFKVFNNLSGSIQSSVYNPRKLRKRVLVNKLDCDFRIKVEEIIFNVTHIPNFQNLNSRIENVQVYSLNSDTYFVVKGVKSDRFFNNTTEKIIYNYLSHLDNPMIFGIIKSTGVEVKFFNFLVDYYTYWQKLFQTSEKDSSELESEPEPELEPKSHSTEQKSKNDVRIQFVNCIIGLTPYQLPCKALLVINQMYNDLTLGEQVYVKSTIRDLNIMLIDDIDNLQLPKRQYPNLIEHLTKQGFLSVGNINNLHLGITYNLNETRLMNKLNNYNNLSKLDIKINIDELNLETCGDSFYTLIQMINDLKIPIILKEEEKFKVKLDKDIDVMKGIEELDFYKTMKQPSASDNFEIVDDYKDLVEDIDDLEEEFRNLNAEETPVDLKVQDDYFNKVIDNEPVKINPVSINLNVGKLNIYMYDGYDWKDTRKVIKGVVKKVENDFDQEESDNDDLEIIQQTLFQSIHVTFPKGINPNDLTSNINKQVNEEEIESHGYKDLKLSRSNKYKMLIELKSIEINVSILSLRDPINEPIDGEYEITNDIDVTVDLVTIYDNLVNSTWNKYLSYMSSMGEKEIGKNMIKLNITTLRTPVNLNYNETIMKISILPVRLFIDQDTNEFMTRFFQFNDDRFNLPKIDEDIYIKKFIMTNDFKFKIDYKPKKINLTGLKNGEINQLLNLININGLLISLNSIKIYGIKGIDQLFIKLFEHWLPNIQNTQLINLFNGIELFKPFINISESLKDLILVPLNDENYYKRVNKQSKNLLKTTSFELLKLGYRLTNGTQNLLEQGEEMLGGVGSKSRKLNNVVRPVQQEPPEEVDDLLENSMRLNKSVTVESNIYNSNKKYQEIDDKAKNYDSDEEIEEEKLISLYSNQPKNFKQGINYSFKSINKNYDLTKNEFLNLIEKFNELDNYEDSLKVLLKKSPLLLIRPLIGTTEVLSKTLMGLSNEISSVDRLESHDKYKQ